MKKNKIYLFTLILLIVFIPLNIFLLSKYLISFYIFLFISQLAIILLGVSGLLLNGTYENHTKIDKKIFTFAILSTFAQICFYINAKSKIFNSSIIYTLVLLTSILLLIFIPINLHKLWKNWKTYNLNSRTLNLLLFLFNLPVLIGSLLLGTLFYEPKVITYEPESINVIDSNGNPVDKSTFFKKEVDSIIQSKGTN